MTTPVARKQVSNARSPKCDATVTRDFVSERASKVASNHGPRMFESPRFPGISVRPRREQECDRGTSRGRAPMLPGRICGLLASGRARREAATFAARFPVALSARAVRRHHSRAPGRPRDRDHAVPTSRCGDLERTATRDCTGRALTRSAR
jgi:hypothetical protein